MWPMPCKWAARVLRDGCPKMLTRSRRWRDGERWRCGWLEVCDGQGECCTPLCGRDPVQEVERGGGARRSRITCARVTAFSFPQY
eukprot:931303-Prymnesium_polylepis.1